MRQNKTCAFAAIAVICILLMAAGCTDQAEDTIQTKVKPQEQKPAVQPALKSAPEGRVTYKVTTDRENGVLWEGPLENKPPFCRNRPALLFAVVQQQDYDEDEEQLQDQSPALIFEIFIRGP